MVGYIYRIHNKITEQNYIGQTIDINRRRRKHFNTLANNTHDNPKLQVSWNKYGPEAFEFEFWSFELENLETKFSKAKFIEIKYSSLGESE